MMNTTNPKKVIIVGAGAAGIAAACRLCENDITDMLILEAEDRIGGRIYTLDVPGVDNILEIGAQCVVNELIHPKDLLVPTNQFSDILFVESNAQIVDAKLVHKMSDIFEFVRSTIEPNVLEYRTSGNYFLEKINSVLQHDNVTIDKDLESEFIEWFHQFINFANASDSWFQSSSSTLTEYWKCEGRPTIAWKQKGYRQIFSILSEKADAILGKSLIENYVKKHTEVVKIIPEDRRVRVKCDNGEEYVADHVIVTVSLGVLKTNYEKLFPKNLLSDKTQKAIKNILMGSVAKIFLTFPYKWWPDNITDIALLWTQSDRLDYEKQGLKWLTDVFAFLVDDNQKETLCGWISGQSARDMEEMDEDLVQKQLVQLLKKFLGDKYNIPEPDLFYRSTWKSNPHFNGAYSLRGTAADLMNVSAADLSIPVLNRDNVPVILFAGEATHPHYYSTVHGALETGWREADRIIAIETSRREAIETKMQNSTKSSKKQFQFGYIESADRFYVVTDSEKEVFIHHELKSLSPKDVPKKMKLKNIYGAKCGQRYRRISHITTNSNGISTVCCIDTGRELNLSKSNIFLIPKPIQTIPRLTMLCKLKKPDYMSELDEWPREITSLLCEIKFLNNRFGLKILGLDEDGESQIVTLQFEQFNFDDEIKAYIENYCFYSRSNEY